MVLGQGEAGLGKPASLTVSPLLCQFRVRLALSYPATSILPGPHRVRRAKFQEDVNRSYSLRLMAQAYRDVLR